MADIKAFFAGARVNGRAPKIEAVVLPDYGDALTKEQKARELDKLQKEARRKAREAREAAGPADGSLAEAEAEGRKLQRREAGRAAYLAKAPTVQTVGAGPEADTRPKCRLCGDHRRLTPALCKLPNGSEGRLCPTCVKQVEWDRERRCVSCGTPVKDWLPGGVCGDCHAAGTERLHNVEELRRKRWIMTPGDNFTP